MCKIMSQLNEKQKEALNLVLNGHNLLITGAAGTGKSFLISKTVEKLKEKGKCVALTCTTGIACSVYKEQATTIHQWTGINDGRYAPQEIKNVIKNNASYASIIERVKKTDVLVVDECSMLSSRMFDSVSEICSIKNEKLLFGGIQIIFCGDFRQLPPVPNTLCEENGDHCFKNNLFQSVLPHRLTLTEVMRQSEKKFIHVIHEVSCGTVSNETLTFIEQLKRPLPDGTSSIKLFSTNDLVDDFNRNRVLDFPGTVHEFLSTDTGERKYLSHVLAPHVLWLKIGTPVMLLRNLSQKLVNGLIGEVFDIAESEVTVEFPSISLRVPLKKMKFSVFSRRENKDIAVREQLPLKLAYGITIHKSQGMTLENVEVDCTGIFKPGQLGVAMGRAKTSQGLRVTNFTLRACMPQPDYVESFLAEPSEDPIEDMSCCHKQKRPEEDHVYTIQDIGVSTDIDINDDIDLDEEFDDIIRSLDSADDEYELPEDLDLNKIFEELKEPDPFSTFLVNQNTILSNMDKWKYRQFCKQEFKAISNFHDKVKSTEGAVKCKELAEMLVEMHEHHTSSEHMLACMQLFEGERFTAEHRSICYNISRLLKTYILSQKAETYPSSSIKLSQRSVTNSCRARIRYIGGYCVAKVRSKLLKKKGVFRYGKSIDSQQQYDQVVYGTFLINKLREDEQFLLGNTSEPDSLLDTQRKQYTNRGLTNISDETFNFFIQLSEHSLKLLTDSNYHKHGSDMFEFSREELINDEKLKGNFDNLFKCHNDKPDNCENLDRGEIVYMLFKKIVKLYLMVLFTQFRKDILDAHGVEKKMAHRKQIQVSSKNKRKFDKETTKKTTKKHKKDKTVVTDESIIQQQQTTEDRHTSQQAVSSSDNHSPQPGTSTQAEEEIKCKICFTANDGEWIACDSCSAWLHMSCAGLKHHMKWKKYTKKSAKFYCTDCI